MKKKMGCKADDEAKYRSNLSVVRILARHPTKQTAFYSPRSRTSDSKSRMAVISAFTESSGQAL